MTEEKRRAASEKAEPNPMEARQHPVDRLEDPAPGGSVSGEDIARPRDREASQGEPGVVPGFTGTGPSGSQSGRSLYGIAPEDEDINPEGE